MPDLRGDASAGRTGAYEPRALAPWIALLVVLLVLAATTALLPMQGRRAPDFALVSTGLEDGLEGAPVAFTLADYRGHPLLLDLMAVSCESCRNVTETVLKPIWQAHHAEGVAILSVDAWADPTVPMALPGIETKANLLALQRATGVPWRHALDTDQVWQKYDAQVLPRVVLVDAHGNIVYDHLGIPERADVEAAVRSFLL